MTILFREYSMKRIIVYGSVVGILALATTIYAVPTSATDSTDVVDQINITVPVSCTLTGTNLLHTTTIQNNQYKTDIGSATIKATCNDTNGLAIYAIGYTNEEDGNNKMHSSTLDSSNDIVTGKYVSGTTTNSVWSMKLTPVSGTYAPTIRNDATYNYTNYELIPAEYTKVAYRTTATDIGTGAQGANFTTNYAVYASTSQPAGTYTGKVKFTLVHPQNEVPAQPIACEGGKICYNPNTALVEGQMGKQTAGNNAEVTLYAPNFKRQGYGFAGWNTAYDGSGTTYGPNQTITTPSNTSTNGLSLYAVWVPSAGTLQNWGGCSSLAQGAVTALTDNRDNNTYAVAKLADNKCWMIENLRLDDTPELSASNTHNPSLPITNIYDATNPTTSNHLSPTTDPTQTTWCTTNSSDCFDQSMLATNNTTLFTSNTASGYSASSNVYSYGNYYNWYSATASHGTYSMISGDATGDICPTGWHLPKGGNKSKESTNEFWQLIVTGINGSVNPANYNSSWYPSYNGEEARTLSNAIRSHPNNFIYSGYVDGSSIISRKSNGAYWSTSIYSGAHSCTLYISDAIIGPGVWGGSKSQGYPIRCVAGV